MEYTIDNFWVPRLAGVVQPSSALTLPGWSVEQTTNPSFVEADLRLRESFGGLNAPIWLVAAPGAVGKSTLAKQISARTGAVYLNLAKAETVAGNYLTGGLVKNQLLPSWEDQKTTILIDALDEARLRVTPSSFVDFLNDVESLARGRSVPTVLFGRVGIVEEAWIILSENGLDCPVLDIDFFDEKRAKRFIMSALGRLANEAGNERLATSLDSHKSMYGDAVANFVEGLGEATASDGARFAGYAPVLEAVATVLSGVTNPANLNDAVQQEMQGQVLQYLADRILDREAEKLRDQLQGVTGAVKKELYSPEEQLTRLTQRIYQTTGPVMPSVEVPSEHRTAYDTALKNFLPQHPFLDGTGDQESGAVFGAVINARALFSPSTETVDAAEKHAGHGTHAPNPFLIDFYLNIAQQRSGDPPLVPPEHIIALYESVLARASVGDFVRLTIEGDEDSEDADVEIHISSAGAQGVDPRILLRTSQAGVLRFGRQVNGVSVDAPQLDVVIGSGNSVEMIAPVSLNVARLKFDCPELAVQRGNHKGAGKDAAVILEASELLESKVTSAPLVRNGTELLVTWPGSSSYPWTQFSIVSNETNSRDIHHDAPLGLRRLVLAFRSHSRGRLARYQDKIEHVRMTKGKLGVAIRERLMRDGILSIEGEMYFLDPDKLGSVVGTKYQDLKMKRFSDEARNYVSSIGIS